MDMAHAQTKPAWLILPELYVRVVHNELFNFKPWWIVNDNDFVEKYNNGLKDRFPDKEFFMFAKRLDNDVIAVFSKEHGERVLLLNDFSSKGWEQNGSFENFEEWFVTTVKEFIDFEK